MIFSELYHLEDADFASPTIGAKKDFSEMPASSRRGFLQAFLSPKFVFQKKNGEKCSLLLRVCL